MLRIALILVVAFALLSCGSADTGGGVDEGVEKIIAADAVFVSSDLDAAGFKMNKQYEVAELPGAIDAWRVVSGSSFVEVRFYPSHDDAVGSGQTPAESVTGRDAVVSGPDVVWQEGMRDRRKCVQRPATWESGCEQMPRYGDFFIIGNMVALCEGKDSSEAFRVCGEFASQLGIE